MAAQRLHSANDAFSGAVFTGTSTQLISNVPTVSIEGVYGNPEAAKGKAEDVMKWYKVRVALEERAKVPHIIHCSKYKK